MATFKIFRETALPSPTVPDSIYIVAPAGMPSYVEIYVTNSSNAVRRVIAKADIDAMIAAQVAAATELIVVADIDARNALALSATRYVFVRDASADTTVLSGGATYLYDLSESEWIKVSEAESLDVVLRWDAIQNRPGSTPSQIDAAVGNAHTHANKTQLDGISQNAFGELTYNGIQVKTEWSSTGW